MRLLLAFVFVCVTSMLYGIPVYEPAGNPQTPADSALLPLKNYSQKNWLHYNLSGLVSGKLNVSLQREVQKNVMLRIPVEVQLNRDQLSSYSTFYNWNFATGAGINFFSPAFRQLKYYMGPEVKIGTVSDNFFALTPYVNDQFLTNYKSFAVGALVNTGLVYHLSPTFSLCGELGLGSVSFTKKENVRNELISYNRQAFMYNFRFEMVIRF